MKGEEIKSLYTVCKDVIQGMEIGEEKSIEIPEKLSAFRRYLIEIGSRMGQKFATKIIDGKLRIMRIKYFNINSKEME